jgi:hypothetical protein
MNRLGQPVLPRVFRERAQGEVQRPHVVLAHQLPRHVVHLREGREHHAGHGCNHSERDQQLDEAESTRSAELAVEVASHVDPESFRTLFPKAACNLVCTEDATGFHLCEENEGNISDLA